MRSKWTQDVKETENELKTLLGKKTFADVKSTIDANQNIWDGTLKHWKLKMLNCLIQVYVKRNSTMYYDNKRLKIKKNKTEYNNFKKKKIRMLQLHHEPLAKQISKKRSNRNLRRNLSNSNF